MMRSRHVYLLAFLVAVAFGCPTKKPAVRGGGPQGPSVVPAAAGDADGQGLQFRLSEGEAPPESRYTPTVAKPEPLSEADTKKIYQRLPPLQEQPDDATDFALRDRSLPPPRTAKKVQTAFPPPDKPTTAPKPETGPLEVLRSSPQGDVPIAPHLSITFSQPMVAVTSHDDLARQGVPVKLSPQPAGHWRWVGARTLLFEPDVRFPMATTYSVEIPAGTKSATGGLLKEAKSWTFQTPAPTIETGYPYDGPHGLEPVFFVSFDQRIDAAAVLATIQVKAKGRTFATRPATDAEIDADPVVKELVARAKADQHEGRWLTFRLTEPLPKATGVSVQVGPGTPSAEGPRTTAAAQSFDFRTYGPLEVVEEHCGWGGECHPYDPWSIRLSNPIDTKAFEKAWVTVAPELKSLKVEVYSDWIIIRGRSKGRTTYAVTLASAIKDVFGQTFDGDRIVKFKVGSAVPQLYAPGGEMVVLDPAAGPRFSVFSTNHKQLKVAVYAVGPEDFDRYAEVMREWQRDRKQLQMPGKKVIDGVVDVKGDPDELSETRIDLAPALQDGLGQLIVVVEPTKQPANRWEKQVVHAWTQATRIGLSAFVDGGELIGWATDLADGKALSGVQLEVTPYGQAATTAADGLATLALGTTSKKTINLLVARKGDDVAILPERVYWWSDAAGWQKVEGREVLRWFVFDDRGMYRPGEEVHVKGWLRRWGTGEGGDVRSLDGGAAKVEYKLQDSQGNEILKGSAKLNVAGGWEARFKLPPTMNLGYAYLYLAPAGGAGLPGNHNHYFQVQEFRRPEFEVSTEVSEGPHLIGGHATVTVSANYYAGGGLPGAETSWIVSTAPGTFVPPGLDDWVFGVFTPWWGWSDPSQSGSGLYASKSWPAKTDASGKHHLRIDFDGVTPPRTMVGTAQATVMDVNRQAWASQAPILVHPAAEYVGLKSEKLFGNEGDPIHVSAIVADLDGKLVAGREIAMRAVRLDWTIEDGTWKVIEEKPVDCAVTSTASPVECVFRPEEGGTYRIRAVVKDAAGRPNQTEILFWVAGGEDVPPSRGVAQQAVQLIPDKKEYKADETAQLLVQAPFAPAEGVVTWRRSGIVHTERFSMKGSSHTLSVPIRAEHTPNLYVQVDLVGAAARTNDVGEPDPKLPKRPAFATGALNLSVPPVERRLGVTVKPREEKVVPGTKTTIDVELVDASGRPVAGAELAVVVVDEAVLALSNYQTPDPLAAFYTHRDPGSRDHHQRAFVVLGNPLDAGAGGTDADGDAVLDEGEREEDNRGGARRDYAGAKPAEPAATPAPDVTTRTVATEQTAAGNQQGQGAQPGIAVRTNFDALAHFAGAVPTDAKGRAKVEIAVPDSLTRYRVMVAAVAGGQQFGRGEAAITARLPLMVRPSPPRFLNFGDSFELPVVLQNQTDEPLTVDVAARAGNAKLTGVVGQRVTVPANDRVEVRFAAATVRAGTARFQVGAASGPWADAAEVKLPVWTPATTEAFATYGEVDKGAIVQPVAAPSGVFEQFGGVEVTTSSTALASLTDAFLYLVSYPFECSEQVASRLLAVAALKDVLGAFQAEGLPPPEEILAAVDRDVARLVELQDWEGGFSWWRQGMESWPYPSIHAMNALVRAKEKGFRVPEETLRRGQRYLVEIERHIPGYYPIDVRRTLIAYALYVRERMGDHDAKKAKGLISQAGGADKLPLEADGFLLFVLSGDSGAASEVAAINKHLNNRAEETAGAAHFTTNYTDGNYLILHSDRRADGIILEALIKDQPKSDLIPKIVRGLLAHRVKGRWANTNESSFVLLALDRYFAVYENVTPDFVARVWLGSQYAGEHAFKGRTTEEHYVEVPMKWLAAKKGNQDLVVEKKGDGRLYYRIGMRYAPTDLKLPPADHGFVVERRYEPVDDPGDVKRDADGTWRVKAGAKVRVRLTMVAQARRYHVALVDPMPAGLEAMNPELAVTGSIPADPQQPQDEWTWWRRTWYEHQNMRDERVEAFTTLLWEGVWNYSYVARATTPGTFVVPPAKAEEMYSPETFGRSGTDRVIVE